MIETIDPNTQAFTQEAPDLRKPFEVTDLEQMYNPGIEDPVAEAAALTEASSYPVETVEDFDLLLSLSDKAARAQNYYGAAPLETIEASFDNLISFGDAHNHTDTVLLEQTIRSVAKIKFQNTGESEEGLRAYDSELARADELRYKRELPERQQLLKHGPPQDAVDNSPVMRAEAEFSELLEDPKLGTYDVIVGDDTSGRLVANFLYKASCRLAAQDPDNYKKPKLLYVAGGRGIENRSDAIEQYFDDQLDALQPNGEKPSVLVATENIETGNSEEKLLEILTPRSKEVSTAALGALNKELDAVERENREAGDSSFSEEHVSHVEAIKSATVLELGQKLGRLIVGNVDAYGSGVQLHGRTHLTEKLPTHTEATANRVDPKSLSVRELTAALADREAVNQLLDKLLPAE